MLKSLELQSTNKKKICIVVSSLGTGGAERSSALLSSLLMDSGYNIHIISVLNNIHYRYSGTLLNLGELKDKDDSVLGRFKRYKVFKSYLKSHEFDYIIDNRSRPTILKEIVISRFLYRSFKHIYVVRSHNLNIYLGKKNMVSKWIYGQADKIVAVSQETKNHIESEYGLDNVTAINNPVDLDELNIDGSRNNDLDGDYILFYGRIDDDVKNISLLIDGFKASRLPDENIRLLILGDGKDKHILKKSVEQQQLGQSIIFKPFNNKPFSIVQNALFTVLTSKYEGFPRVLIESLALGTPVISVDCSSGPREIIENRQNGLLIENNNADALAQAMNNFIFDKALYNTCKNNAKASVQKFSMPNIAKKWQELLV